QRPELRAQHAADQGALTLEQLAHVLAAGTPNLQRIPAVCGLAARRLAPLDRQRLSAIQRTFDNAIDLLLAQLALDAHAELARQTPHTPLQLRSQLAVGCNEFQSAIDSRHRAHSD